MLAAGQNGLKAIFSELERGYLSSQPALSLALDSLEDIFPGPPNGVGFRSLIKFYVLNLSGLEELTLHSPNPRPYNLAS